MNIIIGRYEPLHHPELRDRATPGWEGWVEPEDRSWIVFFDTEGKPTIWLDRTETGAVIGEPIRK